MEGQAMLAMVLVLLCPVIYVSMIVGKEEGAVYMTHLCN